MQKQEKQNFLLIFSVGLFLFGLSFLLFKLSSQRKEIREPASIPSDVLQKEVPINLDLLATASDALLREAKILESEDRFGISLGSFLSKNELGEKTLVCQNYDKISLLFEAQGIAVDGKKPILEVDANCEISKEDFKQLKTIWIPFRKIQGENLNISEVSYYEEGLVTYKFADIFMEWPREWKLQSIRIFNSKEPERQKNFESKDIESLMQKPVSMYWQEE